MSTATIEWLDWHNCYDGNWDGLIVPEAFAHPAKMAHDLLLRIIAHGFERGYWKKGDTLGDPFGGVGTTGIVGASAGLQVVSVELEPRFFELAQANYALHRQVWERCGDPVPVILNGDSRRFAELVGPVVGALTSPPYAESDQAYSQSDDCRKRLEAKGEPKNGCGLMRSKHGMTGDYGTTAGQVGTLKEGSLDAALTSPPYAESGQNTGTEHHPERMQGSQNAASIGRCNGIVTSPPYAESIQGDHGETETAAESQAKRRTPGGSLGQSARHGGYGVSNGQVGALKDEGLDAAVTSPLWEESLSGKGECPTTRPNGKPFGQGKSIDLAEYGTSPGQVGKECGETYWAAMKVIYGQMHAAMKPGGYAAVVVKDYIRNKKRVPLCDQTCTLLEHVGFQMVTRCRCWLVKETKGPDLFGGEWSERTERKSFFRRLYEKKYPANRIDWEEVIWCVRP